MNKTGTYLFIFTAALLTLLAVNACEDSYGIEANVREFDKTFHNDTSDADTSKQDTTVNPDDTLVLENEWMIYNTSNSPLPSDKINWIEIDSEDNIWLATDGGGVFYENQTWRIYNENSLGLGLTTDNFLFVRKDVF